MLSIPEVTVYAFSADNFKRPQAEVDGLMTLAREKFLQLLSEQAKLKEKGVRIRMIGEIDLLQADVRQPAAELEQKTRNNNSYTLNICIAYTRFVFILNNCLHFPNETNINLNEAVWNA
jgi:ditrans,polycis-polyprenyl diphosphate synthase